jgi:hypothetical protein
MEIPFDLFCAFSYKNEYINFLIRTSFFTVGVTVGVYEEGSCVLMRIFTKI